MTPVSEPEPLWPGSLDALTAAPGYHKVLLENERVRVLDTRIAPGERTPIHTHRWPAVFHVLSWSHFVRYDEQGKMLMDSRTVESLRTPPDVLWSGALPPHSLENVGETDLHVLSIELKDHQA
jgi:mannose-6-phosphate isomerase-like protein (cupin superfamily)